MLDFRPREQISGPTNQSKVVCLSTKDDVEMYACMHQLLFNPPQESAKKDKTRFDAGVACDMEYQTESSRSVIHSTKVCAELRFPPFHDQ